MRPVRAAPPPGGLGSGTVRARLGDERVDGSMTVPQPWSPTIEALRTVQRFVFADPSLLTRALIYAQHYLRAELDAAGTAEDAMMPDAELGEVNDFFLSILEQLNGVETGVELAEEQYRQAQGWLLSRTGPFGSVEEMLGEDHQHR